jgi:hypothetical protein
MFGDLFFYGDIEQMNRERFVYNGESSGEI